MLRKKRIDDYMNLRRKHDMNVRSQQSLQDNGVDASQAQLVDPSFDIKPILIEGKLSLEERPDNKDAK